MFLYPSKTIHDHKNQLPHLAGVQLPKSLENLKKYRVTSYKERLRQLDGYLPGRPCEVRKRFRERELRKKCGQLPVPANDAHADRLCGEA